MFRRLYDTVVTKPTQLLLVSPKSILSEFIATTLNVYFVVDPKLIESNLLSDTKIVLRDVQIKPIPLVVPKSNNNNRSSSNANTTNEIQQSLLQLVGEVKEIEFQWTWGSASDGSTSYVRDTKLIIRGATVRIQQVNTNVADATDTETSNADDVPSSSSSTTSSGTSAEEKDSYIRKYIIQIVDHLTLVITDVHMILDIDDTNEFSIHANDIQLTSLGHTISNSSLQDEDDDTMTDEQSTLSLASSLLQRLSIGLVQASIQDKVSLSHVNYTGTIDSTAVPSFELAGYVANIKRLSGQRFMGSIWNNLDIIGETLSGFINDDVTKRYQDMVYIYGDHKQIIVLNRLVSKFVKMIMDASKTSTSNQSGEATTTSYDMGNETNATTTPTPFTTDTTTRMTVPSTFRLQLPGVHITLPNLSSLTIPRCFLKYENNTWSISGTDGITINDTIPIVALVQQTNNSFENLNVIWSFQISEDGKNEFQVCDCTVPATKIVQDTLVTILWNEREMKRLLRGFYEAVELFHRNTTQPASSSSSSSERSDTEDTNDKSVPSSTSKSTTTTSQLSQYDIAIKGNVVIKLESSVNLQGQQDWMEIMVRPIAACISATSANTYTLSTVQGDGIEIYESSLCSSSSATPATDNNDNINDTSNNPSKVALSVPSFDLYPDEYFCFNDTVLLHLDSLDTLSTIHKFIDRVVLLDDLLIRSFKILSTPKGDALSGNTSSKYAVPFPLKMPKIKVLILNPPKVTTEITIYDVSLQTNNVLNIDRVEYTSNSASFALCGAVTSSDLIEISQIERFTLAKICELAEPVNNVSLTYSDRTWNAFVPLLTVMMLSDNGEATTEDTNATEDVKKDDRTFTLPFNIILSVGNTILKIPGSNNTEFEQLIVSLKPVPTAELDLSIGTGATNTEITIHRVYQSDLISVTKLHTSGVMYGRQYRTLYNSYFNVETVDVVAGLSSLDWKARIGKSGGAKRVPIGLPFTQIEGFDVTITYNGAVITSQENLVPISAFSGNSDTTSVDVTNHIALCIVTSVPSFLTNAEIWRLNIADNISSNAGRALLGATVAGSVVGVVAVDAVRGAISQGKSFRGATDNDNYKFGDFTRGIFQTVSDVPNTTATGTAQSVRNYTSENKSRLAGAGGSGLGMVLGTAVAGPIGFFAGAYLGNVLGSKAVEGTKTEDGNNDNRQASVYPATRGDANNTQSSLRNLGLDDPNQTQDDPNKRTRTDDSSDQYATNTERQQNNEGQNQDEQPYRFGDLSRRIAARGKRNDGRSENDRYKFGDITRGFFG